MPRHSLPIRIVLGRPRLFSALVCGVIAYPFLPRDLSLATRLALSWDIFVAAFLVFAAVHFTQADHTRIAADAARQEEGEWTLFALTIIGAIMSFTAIVIFSGLAKAKGHHGEYVALVGLTLAASWLMTQVTFAYRYAHEFYACTDGGPDGGLNFPGEDSPDYLDFIYFSFVLGMTFQVSDVDITGRKMRRLATLQGLIGYMFNTVVLALTINIAAGIF
jgi:Predicted membrane protein